MTSFKRLVISAVIVFCQIYAFSAARAVTYYVKPTGSDAANGISEATAWQHVMKACSTVNAGDTVFIRAGVYDETSNLNSTAWGYPIQSGLVPSRSGAAGSYIVFKGYRGDTRPIIKGKSPSYGAPNTANYRMGALLNSEHHLIYDSLEFRFGPSGFFLQGGGPHDIIIRNCVIDSMLGLGGAPLDDNSGGIVTYYEQGTRNITVENNEIFSCGAWSSSGSHAANYRKYFNTGGMWLYTCDSCLIRNNKIHDVMSGIRFKEEARYSEVYGNTFYNIAYAAMWAHSGQRFAYTGPDHVMSRWHHNIVYNAGICFNVGEGTGGGVQDDTLLYVYNNTCDCSNSGVWIDSGNGSVWGGVQGIEGGFGKAYFFNNIFYNVPAMYNADATDHAGAFNIWSNSNPIFKIYEDYNMLYGQGTGQYYAIGSSEYTLAQWKAASISQMVAGQGAHSVMNDPGFANAAAHDYSIAPTSPAASGGKAGSFTFFPGTSRAQTVTLDSYMGAIAPTGTCTLPATPTLATPANGATGLTQPVVLDWNDVATATNYQVQVDNNSDFSSVALDQQTTVSTISASSLTSGTTFYWRVRAQNSCGWGTWTASRNFAVAACTLPVTAALTLPANGATGLNQPIALDWNDVATVTGYQVQADNNSDFSSPAIDQQLTASAYSASGLTAATTFYWRVRAQNSCGWGPWSASNTFVTISGDLIAPTISAVTALSISDNAATITWSTNEVASTQINYGLTTAYGSTTTLVPTLTLTHSQTLTGLAASTTYHYRVRSRDAAGNEAVSGDLVLTTTESLTNLDNGIVPTVSSTYTGYSEMRLTDGALNPFGAEASTWASGESSTQPHWIEINFGASRQVKRVVLYWAWNSFRTSWMTSRQFALQSWNGTAFVDVATSTNTTVDSCTIISVASFSTSRLRYYQPANMGAATYPTVAWLAEIDVFGTTATNTAPTVPVLSSPAAGATVSTLAPALVLNNATDAQGNPITYDFQVSTATTFATIAAQATGIAQGSGTTTSWTVTPNLTGGTTYYWRVRSYDGALYSAYAAYRSFAVVSSNTAPGVPTPQSPINGVRISGVTPNLVLINSVDPNGDPLTYQFEVYNLAGTALVVQSPMVASGTTTTTWAVTPALAYRTSYTWRVRAYDGQLWSNWTALQTFRTSRAPAVAALMEEPADAGTVQTVAQFFKATSDPQAGGDSVSYQFEIYEDGDSTSLVKTSMVFADSTTVVWAMPADLPVGKAYAWRVRIVSSADSSDWTPLASFTKSLSGLCGDEDASGTVDIRDAIYLLNYMFASGPIPPDSGGDVNCDGQVSVSDAVLLIQYLFAHGSDPCAKCGH